MYGQFSVFKGFACLSCLCCSVVVVVVVDVDDNNDDNGSGGGGGLVSSRFILLSLTVCLSGRLIRPLASLI